MLSVVIPPVRRFLEVLLRGCSEGVGFECMFMFGRASIVSRYPKGHTQSHVVLPHVNAHDVRSGVVASVRRSPDASLSALMSI